MSEINVGAISEALNNKVDLPSPTIPQDAVDYVIEMQRPTADNNYTWYRKYKSGWVEQGGPTSGSSASITVTFPVVMADTNYTAVLGNRSGVYEQLRIATRNTTGLVIKTTVGSGSASCLWQVSGMAA